MREHWTTAPPRPLESISRSTLRCLVAIALAVSAVQHGAAFAPSTSSLRSQPFSFGAPTNLALGSRPVPPALRCFSRKALRPTRVLVLWVCEINGETDAGDYLLLDSGDEMRLEEFAGAAPQRPPARRRSRPGVHTDAQPRPSPSQGCACSAHAPRRLMPKGSPPRPGPPRRADMCSPRRATPRAPRGAGSGRRLVAAPKGTRSRRSANRRCAGP